MSGLAFKIRIELARYQRAAPRFTPVPLLPPVDGDVIVEATLHRTP
jgi:hypothetical protein